jgi:hypothetical protein
VANILVPPLGPFVAAVSQPGFQERRQTEQMPTYDPSLPVRADDGGADHLRRARTCLRDAKPREGVRHLRAAAKLGNGDACGELSFCMQVWRGSALIPFSDCATISDVLVAYAGAEFGLFIPIPSVFA